MMAEDTPTAAEEARDALEEEAYEAGFDAGRASIWDEQESDAAEDQYILDWMDSARETIRSIGDVLAGQNKLDPRDRDEGLRETAHSLLAQMIEGLVDVAYESSPFVDDEEEDDEDEPCCGANCRCIDLGSCPPDLANRLDDVLAEIRARKAGYNVTTNLTWGTPPSDTTDDDEVDDGK